MLEAIAVAADAMRAIGVAESDPAIRVLQSALDDASTVFDAHRIVRKQLAEATDEIRRLRQALYRARSAEPARAAPEDAVVEAAASRLMQIMQSATLPSWFVSMKLDGQRMVASVLLRKDEEPTDVPVIVRGTRGAAHRARSTLPLECAVVAVPVEDEPSAVVAHAISEIARAAKCRANKGIE